MSDFLEREEDEVGELGALFPDSSSDDELEDEIKYDTYVRPLTGDELSLALVKKHHSLWGEFIYNAARVVADYIDMGKIELERGCHVLELGAGAGLPGVMCALHGARTVVLSDYGSEFDRGLVKAMDLNIATFATAGCSLHSVPYIWGKSVDPLLVSSLVTASDAGAGAGARANDDAANLGSNKLFDVVIMADCIFNRSEHKQLCWTLVHTLDKSNPRAVCICSFSHHDPQYMKEDLNFLELVREAGLQCTLVGEEKRKSYPFVEDDGMDEKRGWVYVWAIKWAVPAEIEEGGP